MYFWRRWSLFGWLHLSRSRLAPLRREHAAACAAVHATGFAHPWSSEEFAKLIMDPSAIGLAALDPARPKLRGFVLSRVAADEAEILTIAVSPTCRNYGIGRDLLREHLLQAAFAGARVMFLEVDPDNAAALALYAKFGFAKVGERKGYFARAGGPPATAWVMRRELKG